MGTWRVDGNNRPRTILWDSTVPQMLSNTGNVENGMAMPPNFDTLYPISEKGFFKFSSNVKTENYEVKLPVGPQWEHGFYVAWFPTKQTEKYQDLVSGKISEYDVFDYEKIDGQFNGFPRKTKK